MPVYYPPTNVVPTPTYTVTSATTTRTINPTSANVTAVANVVGTIIQDLQAMTPKIIG